MQSRGTRTRGRVWVQGTEEATRGDYEDNPPDRRVAKSVHSVRLRSAARKGKMSRGERCIHSMETDGWAARRASARGQPVWQRDKVGSRSSGKGRGARTADSGQRLRAQKNPRTCPEKYRVTCLGTGMREIASRTQPGQRQRDGRRAHCPSPGPFHTGRLKGNHFTCVFSFVQPVISRTAVASIPLLRLNVVVSF